MQRRTFVASLAAGSAALAGCGGLSEEDLPEQGTDGTGDQNNAPDTGGKDDDVWQDRDELADKIMTEPVVVTFETARVSASVPNGSIRTNDGIRVTLDFETGATADAPATLVATVVNSASFEQTVHARRLLVLEDTPRGRTDDRDPVYLAPTEDHPLAETVPEYERDNEGRWRVRETRRDWFPRTITLEPDAGLVARYHLLASPDHDDPPIGPGQYRFHWRDSSLEIAVWDTDHPGPDGESRFAGADPPALEDEAEMAWYHDAMPETALSLRPGVETVELPASIDFELVNHGCESASGNPYFWRIHKLVEGEWFPVYPWEWSLPLHTVHPGQRDESTLGLYHDDPVQCRGTRTVGRLGGGRYAYEVGYDVDGETHAAMFDVDAPELTVDLEAEATIVEDGTATVVELPNHVDARQPAAFVVERADATAIDRQFIPEQLSRRPFRGYRNALPLFEGGVERVAVRTDRGTALRPLKYEKTAERTVAYRGQTYRVTGELLEG